MIESQSLPCTPDCSQKIRTLTFHPHPTFTTPLFGSAFKIWSEVCGGAVLRKQLTCFSRWIFSQRSYMAGVWQLWLRFKPLRLDKEILNSSCLLILLIQIISGIFRTPFTSIMLLLATVNLIQQKSKLQNQIFLLKKPISCVRKYLFGLLLFRKPFGKGCP